MPKKEVSMNIIKKKFAYLFAMGVFVLGISSSIPVFAASSSNIHQREYMTLWVKTDGGNLNVREDASLSAKIVGKLKNGTRISGWSVFGKEADGYSWTHVTAPDINGVEIWGWVVDDYLTGVEPKNNQINSFSADVG